MNASTGDAHWVFESQDRGSNDPAPQNLTDKRFFWLALYAQPGLWIGLAIFAIVRLENPIWLSLVGKSGSLIRFFKFPFTFPNENKKPEGDMTRQTACALGSEGEQQIQSPALAEKIINLAAADSCYQKQHFSQTKTKD